MMAEGVFHGGGMGYAGGSVEDRTFHRPALADKAGG
jgi:hypothetical protein